MKEDPNIITVIPSLLLCGAGGEVHLRYPFRVAYVKTIRNSLLPDKPVTTGGPRHVGVGGAGVRAATFYKG